MHGRAAPTHATARPCPAARCRRRRVPQRLSLPSLLALLLVLAACAPTPTQVDEERMGRAREAARAVRDDLRALRDRAEAAAGALPDLAPLTRGERFSVLEQVRRAHGVDGLLWEDPAGEGAWAGEAVDAHAPAREGPWAGSWREGPLALHAGPVTSALVLGPRASSIGFLSATMLLEQRTPAGQGARYGARWLAPLGVAEVQVLPPGTRARPEPPDAVWAEEGLDASAQGTPGLLVRVRALGASATADRLAARREAWTGIACVVLLAVGVGAAIALVRRRLAAGWVRSTAWALLVLAVRASLSALDLPARFPRLQPGFAPTDFGVEGWLGWLGSPGDLALTALAGLALCLSVRGPSAAQAPARRRIPHALLGFLLAAGSVWGWSALVQLVADQGRTPFFESAGLLPPGPVILMLAGLVASTAAGIVLVMRGVEHAASALDPVPGWLARALVAALAAGVAWLATDPHPAAWSCVALALIAIVAPQVRPRTGTGRAGSVLLLGVVATLVLFPALRSSMRPRSLDALRAHVERVVLQRDALESQVRLDLASLAQAARLQDALAATGAGERASGLALELWLMGSLAAEGRPGVLEVLDAGGRALDGFALDATPRSRLPEAIPAQGPDDLEVQALAAEGARLASVSGRVRVRGTAAVEGGERPVIGHVVLTVPDPVDLRVLDIDPGESDPTAVGAPWARRPLEYALVQDGRVVACSSSQASREPGAFDRGLLLDPGPPGWRARTRGGYEIAAAWLPSRGQWFVARRASMDLGERLLALARLVVVGVGGALGLSLLVFVAGLRRIEWRLHHRILVSYLLVSVLPLGLLAWVTAEETSMRYERAFSDRLENNLARLRSGLEAREPSELDRLDDEAMRRAASDRRHDVVLYRSGLVSASSRAGAVTAELLPSRLDAEAYRATVLERRATVQRAMNREGRLVWTGYAPVLGADGWARATVAVPLLYERDRIEAQLSVTGSVVLAGYLLTLVLVMAVGLLVSRRLAQPLDELVAAAEQVAQGDLEVALRSDRGDEFGRLMRAFREMTASLREATDRAARAEREQAWRRMARQVAHEIKNPLSPMKLMVQQMEADIAADPAQAPQAVQRTAAVLLRQVDALARIATTFGDLANLPPRRPGPVSAAALVEHVVDLHAGARAHGVHVRREVEPGLPVLLGDEDELHRALVNLVNNAVQSVPSEGEVLVRALCGTSSRGRPGVVLEVHDTGQGIPAEHRDRVFEPTFSTKTSGTGLGLAIVKRIVDDHGGEVGFAPRPGGGTTFSVWLPAAPQA